MGLIIGTMFVRRSGFIDALSARIWQEFTSLEALDSWFGRGHVLHRYEARLGGEIELSIAEDGQELHFGGRICVFEPKRELSVEINWEGANALSVSTFWTIRLTPQHSGTQVEIIHHGFERLGTAASATLEAYEAGWDNKHIKALRALVET